METIHLKTTDPVSQHLLRSAAHNGIELFWDRYEKAQPQDGFMRLGLCCPFGCLYGPCRIDPFGRGPASGICGMSREQMVAGTLLRLCQQGAMQALAATPQCIEWQSLTPSTSLGKLIDNALSRPTQAKLSCSEIFASTRLLQNLSTSYLELLHQALRLALLSLVLVEQADASAEAEAMECSLGYGVIAEAPLRIGFSGRPSPELIMALKREADNDPEVSAVLLSLGDWLELDGQFMPICTTSGEAELLLSSGAVHLLVAGPGTDPGILHTCDKMQVPVVADGSAINPTVIIEQARTRSEKSSHHDLFTAVPARLVTRVIMSETSPSQSAASSSESHVALIGGADSPHLPLGSLAADLANGLAESSVKIASWGDTALWLARQAQQTASAEQPLILDARKGPVMAVKGLAEAGRINLLKGICFTGIKSIQEFGVALGLAYLGCRVSIATPIPIYGSAMVRDMLSQMIKDNGGELLHFDQPANAKDLLDWFSIPQ